MKATFDHLKPETSNTFTFYFKSQQPVHYIAGQFTQLKLVHEVVDERNDKRWFTLSSSPTEPLLSITTKLLPQNGSSFKAALQELSIGSVLDFDEPMGDFVLPKDPLIPLVFVAGGIGVTPFRSMIKYLLDTKEKRNITLVYTMNRLEDVVFKELFEQYNTNVVLIPNEPPAGWSGESGTINAKKILKFTKTTDNTLMYLAGPEPMLETLRNDLTDHGVSKARLITDFFPGYTHL